MIKRQCRGHGAKVAVAITFDMDADSLVHVIAHPKVRLPASPLISMLRYGPGQRTANSRGLPTMG